MLVQTTQLCCVECASRWTDESERWRMKVLFDEQPPLAVVYCPVCHQREFES